VNHSIKNWPLDDRPREKLLLKGEKFLSDSELLAIVLRNGVRGKSAIDLARNIITKFGSFRNLSTAQDSDWSDFKGIGKAKLAQIRAALEIGKRLWEGGFHNSENKVVDNAKIATELVKPRMRDAKKEMFVVLLLDSRNRLIEVVDFANGTVNEVRPIIREIFHAALKKFSSAIVCVHNHPSGDHKPSPEDVNLTKEIEYAGKIMNITLRDHIIIANDCFFSFSNEGMLN